MSIDDLIKKAQKLFKSRQFDEAELILQKVLATEPENHDAQLGYALLLLMQSRVETSWEYLKQAQKSRPENPKVYQAIAMLMRMTGALDQAITYLQLQITTSPMLIDPQVHVTLAELYAAQGDTEAIRTLLDFLQHLPIRQPRKQFWLYVELNDPDGLDILSDRTQLAGFKNLCHGQSATFRGEIDIAHQYYQWAADQNPKLWEAQIGLAASPKTSVSQARQHLIQAQNIAPQTAEAHIALAEWHFKTNQLTDAIEMAEKLSSSPAVFQSVRDRAQYILTSSPNS